MSERAQVQCALPGGRKIDGLFNFGGNGWRVHRSSCVVRRRRPCAAPTLDAPRFMAGLDEARGGMVARVPVLDPEHAVLGKRLIDRAAYDLVVKAWPGATWLVHRLAAMPVLAVAGGEIVGVGAPKATEALVARLLREKARAAA
jgi:hypothetical protein